MIFAKYLNYKFLIRVFIVCMAVAWLYVHFKSSNLKMDIKPIQPEVKLVELDDKELLTVQKRDVSDTIRVEGFLIPRETFEIVSPFSEKIKQFNVEVGDLIKSGEQIAELDTADLQTKLQILQAQKDAAKFRLENAFFTYEQNKSLEKDGYATPSVVKSIQADILAAQAENEKIKFDISQVEQQIKEAKIFAPFTGVVSSKNGVVGQKFLSGTPIMNLVNLSTLEFQANVPYFRIKDLRIGQKAILSILGIPADEVLMAISRIGPSVVKGTQTIPVYFKLLANEVSFKDGLCGTGYIVADEKKDIIAIPQSAVYENPQTKDQYLYKCEKGRIIPQKIKSGFYWKKLDLLEITEGVSVGDKIVLSPLPEYKANLMYVVSSSS